MTKARSMLDKVREMEVSGQNPMLAKIGSIERLEQVMSQPPPDVDPRAGQFLTMCVRRWLDGTDRSSNEPVPEEFYNV
jgi:hypothetical protein